MTRVDEPDESLPRRTALDPEPPELDDPDDEDPDEPDLVEPPPELLVDPLELGGAERTGCDCGASRVLEPALDDEELGGGAGGGASLVVVVRGMACATAMAGTDSAAAIAETRNRRQLLCIVLPLSVGKHLT